MKYIYLIFLVLNIISINEVRGQCPIDTIPPVAICQTSLTVSLDSFGLVEVQAMDIDDGSSDNCGIETYTINGVGSINLNCLNIGVPVAVELVVTDTIGNSDTCNTFITVADNMAPIPVCAPAGTISVALDALGTAIFPVAQVIVGSSDNCSIALTHVNDEIAPILTCEDVGVYPYFVKMKDPSNNIGWCQSQIEVTWGAACGFAAQLDSLGRTACDAGVCTGYAALSTNGATGAVSYLWEDGSTAIVRNNLCAGKYVVVATDFTGAIDTLKFRIRFDEDCVWPGDTDNNTKANNFDLLPIALAYGTPGAARVGATNGWSGQSSNDWNIPLALAGLPNYKHIDCNGDAMIDSFDVQAILINYAASYWRGPGTTPIASSSHSQDPPLYVDCDTVREGAFHCMGVNLGTAAAEAIDAYAIAFTINYDHLLVDSATIIYGSSWLGTAQELISVEKNYSTHGKLETAVGRTNHQPITGNGRIGTVCFTIRDDILRVTQPDTVVMPISVSGVRFVDEKGNEMPTETQEGCLTIVEVMDAVKVIDNNDTNVNLYPNPTTGWVKISGLENGIQKIVIRTITGELLMSKIVQGENDLELNLSNLPEAVYLVSIETSDKIINKKLLIVRG